MKCPILAPEVNRTSPPSSATSVAIERLGSSKIRTETSPRTTLKGSTPFRNSRTWAPFFDASMAHQMTTTRRATSDGWKLIGPMFTHRRAPLSDGAMVRVNGSSGISRKQTVMNSSGQAQARHR